MLELRPDLQETEGDVPNTAASIHDAMHGEGPYADPAWYGDVTHPTPELVQLMVDTAVRIGVDNAYKPGVWHLDQAMGGGKSHCLVGLWHLAAQPDAFRESGLGRLVWKSARDEAGMLLPDDLGRPVAVVLDCDSPAFLPDRDGEAQNLAERFLWRLLADEPDRELLFLKFRSRVADKEGLRQIILSRQRPVLILIDEILDFAKYFETREPNQLHDASGFLRALLDVAGTTPRCTVVMAMIRADLDSISGGSHFGAFRRDLEALLTRNARQRAVSSGGDFLEIVQCRLFTNIKTAAATEMREHTACNMEEAAQRLKLRDHDLSQDAIRASWPFHPDLTRLARERWSHHAGFQKVRSMLRIFSNTVWYWLQEGREGRWTPELIGPGDIPLDIPGILNSLLGSGLITDASVANFREVIRTEVAAPLGSANLSTAQRLDNEQPHGTQPRLHVRGAGAILVHSLAEGVGQRTGATEHQLYSALVVSNTGYTTPDGQDVWRRLHDQLQAVDVLAGTGGRQGKRLRFTTRMTLSMLVNEARRTLPDTERDLRVSRLAAELFGRERGTPLQVIPLLLEEGDQGQVCGPDGMATVTLPDNAHAMRDLLHTGTWDLPGNRLLVLDSRWMVHGDDAGQPCTQALEALLGVAGTTGAVHAASTVLLVAGSSSRSQTRRIVGDWLAREQAWAGLQERFSGPEHEHLRRQLQEDITRTKGEAERAVRNLYMHVGYVTVTANHRRQLVWQRLSTPTVVGIWELLEEHQRAWPHAGCLQGALAAQLSEQDWNLPLSELKDRFFTLPHLPLMPSENALKEAIYSILAAGEGEIQDGQRRKCRVDSLHDVDLRATDRRLCRATTNPLEEAVDWLRSKLQNSELRISDLAELDDAPAETYLSAAVDYEKSTGRLSTLVVDGDVFIWRPLNKDQLQQALHAVLDQYQRLLLSDLDRSWQQNPHLVGVLTTLCSSGLATLLAADDTLVDPVAIQELDDTWILVRSIEKKRAMLTISLPSLPLQTDAQKNAIIEVLGELTAVLDSNMAERINGRLVVEADLESIEGFATKDHIEGSVVQVLVRKL
ncbi:MAG: DUF499 domain-containing protein [Caldilineaceae bacterium]|nr:DUF499 domain-containing protein [Caldilineaceae bacterium]